MPVKLKNAKEIETIRLAGQAAGQLLQSLVEAVAPGVSTYDLDRLSRKTIRSLGGVSSFLNYSPQGYPRYPATVCTSINDEVVHGIPSKKRVLAEGDIIGVDVAMILGGYHGDNAFTVPVGSVSPEASRLMEVTQASLDKAIEAASPGNRLGDVGYAVQEFVESHGFSVVRDLCGHGIGKRLWEEPEVYNYGVPDQGTRLRPGMVLAIEPMVNTGSQDITTDPDGWTTRSADGSLSAHFEHTVVILSDGPELLTRNDALWT
jgi:methionyl aminopeptidase